MVLNKKSIHAILLIIMILEYAAASSQISMPDTVCVGTTRQYRVNDASIPSTYTWKIDGVNQPTTKNEVAIKWSTPGKFLITVQEHSADGCDGPLQSGDVYVYAALPGIRYPAITAIANVAVQLSARTFGNGSTYNWMPSTGLNFTNIQTPVFKYDKTTDYLVKITPSNGCTVVDSLLVFVGSPAPGSKSSLYIPTAWTPNGDGHNDKLVPLATNIRQIHFKIFNRWGQLLFESARPGEGWDGAFKGRQQTAGVYVWFVEAEGWDGVLYKLKGTSVLIR